MSQPNVKLNRAVAEAAMRIKYGAALAEAEAFRLQVEAELAGYPTLKEAAWHIPALVDPIAQVIGQPVMTKRAYLINQELNKARGE